MSDITLEERQQLGKAKKLWRIEVICLLGTATHRHALDNQTSDEVFQFRKNIFAAGIMLPVDPGRWAIVAPWNITEVTVWRQEDFFKK